MSKPICGDLRQPAGGVLEGAVPAGRAVRVDLRALGPGEQLVPGAEYSARSPVDPDRVARGPGEQLAHRVVGEQLPHARPDRAGPTRWNRSRPVSRSASTAAETTSRPRWARGRHGAQRPGQHPGAVLQVVGQVLDALPGVDLHLDPVQPGGERVAPGLHRERPGALAGRHHGRVPQVQPRLARGHPDERPGLAVRPAPGDVGRDRVMPLAEDGGLDRHPLAHHGAGGIAPAGDDGRDVRDSEPTGHDWNRTQRVRGGHKAAGLVRSALRRVYPPPRRALSRLRR